MRNEAETAHDGVDARLAGNIGKFYLYKAFFGFLMGAVPPIIILYLAAKPLSYTLIMVLMTAMSVGALVAALPSGLLADRRTRKASICVGMALLTASFVVLVVTKDFPVLLVAFIGWGVGGSFSGVVENALLYDTLKALGREAGFRKTVGNATSVYLIATVLGSVYSGLVVAPFGLAAPMKTAAAALTLGTVTALTFREPPMLDATRAQERGLTLRQRTGQFLGHLAAGGRLLVGDKGLLVLALAQVLLLRSYNLVNRPFAQPTLVGLGFSASAVSYVFAGTNLLSAAAARLSDRMAGLLGDREHRGVASVLVLGVLSLALFAFAAGGILATAGFAALCLAHWTAGPILAAGVNRRVPSRTRATCLSMVSMGDSVLAMAAGPLFGSLIDAHSLSTGRRIFFFSFAPLFVAVVMAALLLLRPRRVRG